MRRKLDAVREANCHAFQGMAYASVRDGCDSFHGTHLPATTPSQTDAKPTKTLKATYAPAIRSSPCCIVRNVSNSNVENVVYAPIKPMGIKYRQFALQCVRSASSVMNSPIKKDPEQLMANVP